MTPRPLRPPHCGYCASRVSHPARVKVILPGLTAWLARKSA